MINISGEYVNYNTNGLKSLLLSLGYQIKEYSNYFTCNAAYRSGDDSGSVAVYDDLVKDFVLGKTFTHKEFVEVITGAKSEEELKKILDSNEILINPNPEPKLIKQIKKFDPELLNYLQPDYSYPLSRGISEETLKLFKCGFVGQVRGKLRNRFVFVIYNSKNEIVGFDGRALDDNNKIKWQKAGTKSDWVYPAYINDKHITNSKCVILVESIFDLLSLFECGIFNVICIFGTEMSLAVLNYLLRRNVEKIVISLNNELESANNGAGNRGSKKCYGRLLRYYDQRNLLEFPVNQVKDGKIMNDFNASDKSYIKEIWFPQLKLIVGEKYFQY